MTIGSVATKTGAFAVEEMTETAFSMGMMNVRGAAVSTLTTNIQNDFLKEVVQDGVGAGFSVMTGALMNYEQALIQSTFNVFGSAATAIVIASKNKASSFLKGKKGRKLTLRTKALKFFSNFTTEDARLVADFGAINANSRGAISQPSTMAQSVSMSNKATDIELRAEGVRTSMAQMGVTALAQRFEMKLNTSTFDLTLDKDLIKKVLGVVTVTDSTVDKLNHFSEKSVAQDSSGNWMGLAKIQTDLMVGLRFQS